MYNLKKNSFCSIHNFSFCIFKHKNILRVNQLFKQFSYSTDSLLFKGSSSIIYFNHASAVVYLSVVVCLSFVCRLSSFVCRLNINSPDFIIPINHFRKLTNKKRHLISWFVQKRLLDHVGEWWYKKMNKNRLIEHYIYF